MKQSMKTLALVFIAFSAIITHSASAHAESTKAKLEQEIKGEWRSPENRVRDQYRHPLETLSFFGIKPNATIIELFPSGKAYYAEILAPFLKEKGHYIAVNVAGDPEDAGQHEKFSADPAHYSKIEIRTVVPPTFNFGPNQSADFFLTFRNVHNFAMKGAQADLFKAIFNVLKSGGVLGVVDHRAAEGKTVEEVLSTGYLPEAFVIAEAEKAGFKLVGKSEINKNAKDSKDHPKGVWSLPPTYEEGDKDREKYAAIGESDRFTLRFVKP